jgi:ECF sigma factor
MTDVTRVLSSMREGDPKAAEQLLPLVYDELRRLAAQKFMRPISAWSIRPKFSKVGAEWRALLQTRKIRLGRNLTDGLQQDHHREHDPFL